MKSFVAIKMYSVFAFDVVGSFKDLIYIIDKYSSII